MSLDDIIKDTYEIDFRKSIELKKDGEDVESSTIPLESMLDEKVVSLYGSAIQNMGKETEICLKTVPYSAELVSLYCIPYISRSNILTDQPLLEFYRDMLNKPSMDRGPDLNKLRREHLETGIMESTVIAQVLVWCNEVFYVKDVDSGTILQGRGDGESRNIPHLVRMEMTVKTDKDDSGRFRNLMGNWIITDIDDLLEGNLIV